MVDVNNKTTNPAVDVTSSMDDLSMFATGSAAAVYASHVLEHGSYAQPRSARWPGRDRASSSAGVSSVDMSKENDVKSECSSWVKDYNVRPGETWGRLPLSLRARWAAAGCDALLAADEAERRGSRPREANRPGHEASLGIFAGSEVATALAEWQRVLALGGVLLIAVPDLPTLFRLYLENDSINARVFFSRLILGGHIDAHDIHLAGFDFNLLSQVVGITCASVLRAVSF